MDQSTEVKPEPVQNGDSSWFGVSVRAWITVLIVFSACSISVLNAISSFIYKDDIVVSEPLYSAFFMALGFYLGQKMPSIKP